ncbi:MAG: ATP synthase F1 subunit gamma [Alphaproteobacteria bacterium]
MSCFKELRNRLKSTLSTQKLTTAMKWIATTKLKYYQKSFNCVQAYAKEHEVFVKQIMTNAIGSNSLSYFINHNNKGNHLILLLMTDKGLCGNYNEVLFKNFIEYIKNVNDRICVGLIGEKSKLFIPYLKKEEIPLFWNSVYKSLPSFENVNHIADTIIEAIDKGILSRITIISGLFHNILVQKVQEYQLFPYKAPIYNKDNASHFYSTQNPPLCENWLPFLKKNIGVQLYRYLVEHSLCEYASQMVAMDQASQNAEKMIKQLTLHYNYMRQASITNGIIEIVSGAEAVSIT